MAQDGHKPLTDVAALMKERQKLEAWLAALEARRGSTPERVFERVRADYEARLDRVMGDLLTHRDALEARVRELDGRLNELETGEQRRRDQRAEMELRAMVGELGEGDFAQAAREVDEAIARATTEKGNIRLALEEANDLLRAATTPRPITPVPAAPRAPAVAAPAARAPEPMLEPHRTTAARQLAQQPAESAPPAAAPAPAPAPAGPTIPPRPAPRPSAPVRAATVAEAERAAAANAPPVAPRAEPPAAPMQPAMAEPSVAPEPGNGMRGPAPSNAFDELAFLNSIVGEDRRSGARPAAPQPQAPPPAAPPPPPRPTSTVTLGDLGVMREDITGADSIRASRATGVASDVSGIVHEENVSASLVGRAAEPPADADIPLADADAPLADNVTGNHPIVLRPAGDVAQHKTLRCNECGAMNYPTEWYCERCGAELAAL